MLPQKSNKKTAPQKTAPPAKALLAAVFEGARLLPTFGVVGANTNNGGTEQEPYSVRAVEKIIKGPDSKPLTDFDVETRNSIIEVTGGSGTGKPRQIRDNLKPVAQGKEVILYGAKLGGTIQKNLAKIGIKSFTNLNKLLEYLKTKK